MYSASCVSAKAAQNLVSDDARNLRSLQYIIYLDIYVHVLPKKARKQGRECSDDVANKLGPN